LYKKHIRKEKISETVRYSNNLHEALLQKTGQNFWKTWKSKFKQTVSQEALS